MTAVLSQMIINYVGMKTAAEMAYQRYFGVSTIGVPLSVHMLLLSKRSGDQWLGTGHLAAPETTLAACLCLEEEYLYCSCSLQFLPLFLHDTCLYGFETNTSESPWKALQKHPQQ